MHCIMFRSTPDLYSTTTPQPPPGMTTKTVSRHSQISPRRQNCPGLRATALEICKVKQFATVKELSSPSVLDTMTIPCSVTARALALLVAKESKHFRAILHDYNNHSNRMFFQVHIVPRSFQTALHSIHGKTMKTFRTKSICYIFTLNSCPKKRGSR